MTLPKIPLDGISDRVHFVEEAYNAFNDSLQDKATRIQFKNNTLFVNFKDWVDDKPEIFWHIIGLEDNDAMNFYPCSNNPIQLLCKKNCDTLEWQVNTIAKTRLICIYRASHMPMIEEVIKLANSNNQLVKIWIDRGRTFIRYENGLDDYVVILEKLDKYENAYKLVTAYPVFFRSQKKNFDRTYSRFLENLSKK